MAITVTYHMESVARGGATSVVVTCQRVMEPHRIHRRKWSRVVAVTMTCQGVMEPCGIHRRKWSRVVAITMACQGVQARRQWKSKMNLPSTKAWSKAYGGNPVRTARGRNLK